MENQFVLWVVDSGDPFPVCYGTQSEMNDIALGAGIAGDVYVLPRGQRPLAVSAAESSDQLSTQILNGTRF